MSTTELTTQPHETSLVPKAKLEDIQKLDVIVRDARHAIETAPVMTRAFLVASAMKQIEQAITDDMFNDIMNLMDSPLGFKTDRPPGTKKKVNNKMVDVQPYAKSTVKRCVIVALLAGANLTGNEFNILVGQAYFTKEFKQRVVNEWPGITQFQMEIGSAKKHGDKTAIMEGRAQWKFGGETHTVECCGPTDENPFDARIVVNAYATDGPDRLRGLGESKLLTRVVARLTGLNVGSATDDPVTMDGTLVPPSNIEGPQGALAAGPASVETKAHVGSHPDVKPPAEPASLFGEDPDAEAAQLFVEAARDEIKQAKTLTAVKTIYNRRCDDLATSGWSSGLKQDVDDTIKQIGEARKTEIRNK